MKRIAPCAVHDLAVKADGPRMGVIVLLPVLFAASFLAVRNQRRTIFTAEFAS
jgi:hypothetical protein